MERLAAAAAFFLVRVLEFESSIETFTDKVQFGSVDIGQALGINNYFDPVARHSAGGRRREGLRRHGHEGILQREKLLFLSM